MCWGFFKNKTNIFFPLDLETDPQWKQEVNPGLPCSWWMSLRYAQTAVSVTIQSLLAIHTSCWFSPLWMWLWGANSWAHSSDLPTPGDSTPTVLARRHWSGHQALGASCRTTADGRLSSSHRLEDLVRSSHRMQKKKQLTHKYQITSQSYSFSFFFSFFCIFFLTKITRDNFSPLNITLTWINEQ